MKNTQLMNKEGNTNALALALFLKKLINNNQPSKEFLVLAKEMIAGKVYQLDYDLNVTENDYVIAEYIDVVSDYEKEMQETYAIRQYYFDLLESGANGDAQAAIEYCAALKEGRCHYGIAYA